MSKEQNREANSTFLYAGNHIVKLWEQYLKSINKNIKLYTQGKVKDSIFLNGLQQTVEVAMVLNNDHTPYRNKGGQTVTICGEINYEGDSAKDNISQAIEQIQSYNNTEAHKTKIINHIIIFPYHPNARHWNLGIIQLTLEDSKIKQVTINIYEPYGRGNIDGERYIQKTLKDLPELQGTEFTENKLDHKKQQHDNTSCGAISAENGKEFLKQKKNGNNFLEEIYDSGAEKLRQQHMQEISLPQFDKEQAENQEYEAQGDKPIENEDSIVIVLLDLIQQPENNWVKPLLLEIKELHANFNSSQQDNTNKNGLLDEFKRFLNTNNSSGNLEETVLNKIIRGDGELQEGAFDLIIALADASLQGNLKPTGPMSSFRADPINYVEYIKESHSFTYSATSIKAEGHPDAEGQLTEIIKRVIQSKEATTLQEFHTKVYGLLWEDPSFENIKYKFNTSPTIYKGYPVRPFHTSDNLLFYLVANNRVNEVKSFLQCCIFPLSTVQDGNKSNMLHLAAWYGHTEIIAELLSKYKDSGDFTNCINHHNEDGTTPLGMAFSHINQNIPLIKIATMFAGIPGYRINDYLNNKIYMDYSNCPVKYSNGHQIGGTTLLHNILLVASKCTNSEEKTLLSAFFKVLQKRSDIEEERGQIFNPKYPTMNPGQLSSGLDGHMISTSRLLEVLPFKSNGIKILCQKYFESILKTYEVAQYDDSSGDSAEDDSPAHMYKEMLKKFDEFIKQQLGNYSQPNADPRFQRTFDKFTPTCSLVPKQMWPFVSAEPFEPNAPRPFDQGKWDNYWQELNQPTLSGTPEEIEGKQSRYKNAIENSIVVPLFHGVPLMNSQYTNQERREVAKKIFEINNKLLAKYKICVPSIPPLSPSENIQISIHSRTATASAGMQSLYEIMVADKEELDKLEAADTKLLEYFIRPRLPANFKSAMKDYIFNFSTSPIESFWKNNNDGALPDAGITKYRFPVIATSKTPDHAIRFGIGRSVEGNRGETPMQPEYIDGYPTHRLAGFVYVTLHKLPDLMKRMDQHTLIDVNQGLKLGQIEEGNPVRVSRIKNQLECDFLGKMDSENVVAIIPIIYPHIRDQEYSRKNEKGYKAYHQSIWGLNFGAKSDNVVHPDKIKEGLNSNPNPEILNPSINLEGFGKMLVPSIIDLANGIITAIAKLQSWFLCSIKDNNKLIPYKVKFDESGMQFSHARNALDPDNTEQVILNRVWVDIARQIYEEQIQKAEEASNKALAECITNILGDIHIGSS
jgi:hypothetical protein